MHARPDPTPPAGAPLLLGRLGVKRPRESAPYLVIEGHCPACGRRHRHGWPVEYGLDAVAHRTAHCGDPASPAMRTGYYIALDPALDRESRQILARFPRRR